MWNEMLVFTSADQGPGSTMGELHLVGAHPAMQP